MSDKQAKARMTAPSVRLTAVTENELSNLRQARLHYCRWGSIWRAAAPQGSSEPTTDGRHHFGCCLCRGPVPSPTAAARLRRELVRSKGIESVDLVWDRKHMIRFETAGADPTSVISRWRDCLNCCAGIVPESAETRGLSCPPRETILAALHVRL